MIVFAKEIYTKHNIDLTDYIWATTDLWAYLTLEGKKVKKNNLSHINVNDNREHYVLINDREWNSLMWIFVYL